MRDDDAPGPVTHASAARFAWCGVGGRSRPL